MDLHKRLAQPIHRAIIFMIALCLGAPANATSRNLAPNPSFDIGETAPTDWTIAAGAVWNSAVARSGHLCIESKTSRPTKVCSSRPIPIDSAQSYRVAGWIHTLNGRA